MRINMKPASVIKARLGIQSGGPAHAFFTSRCDVHMIKYIPYGGATGGDHLVENKDIGVNYIRYNMPYAHYMYEGKVMGPNIPIKEDGIIVGWFSPKGQPKHYTGKDIDYSNSVRNGHQYAGPKWDERMWSAEKDEVVAEVQKYVETHGGK